MRRLALLGLGAPLILCGLLWIQNAKRDLLPVVEDQSSPLRRGSKLGSAAPDLLLDYSEDQDQGKPWSIGKVRREINELRQNHNGSELNQQMCELFVDELKNVPSIYLSEFYTIVASELSGGYLTAVVLPLVARMAVEATDDLELLLTDGIDSSARNKGTLYMAGKSMAAESPESAVSFLQTLSGSKQLAYCQGILSVIADSDIDQALKITAGFPEERQEALLESIVNAATRSSDDPSAILDKISSSGFSMTASVANAIMRNWTRDDPSEAANYVVDQQDYPQAAVLMSGLLSGWVRVDEVAASQWLVENNDLEGWDSAVSEFSRRLSIRSGSEALQWAAAIRDDAVRLETIAEVYHNWVQHDRTSADLEMKLHLSDEDYRDLFPHIEQPLPTE